MYLQVQSHLSKTFGSISTSEFEMLFRFEKDKRGNVRYIAPQQDESVHSETKK